MTTPTTNSISFSYPLSSGYIQVDAILYGTEWGYQIGAGVNLTYSFPGYSAYWSIASYGQNTGTGEPYVNFAPFSSDLQALAISAMASWSDVANINFTLVPDNNNSAGDIRFGISTSSSGGAAHAYGPGGFASSGDVWLDPNGIFPSNYLYETLIHELGHALGLKHSFEAVSFNSSILPNAVDGYEYTVMSYSAFPGLRGSLVSFNPTTPMMFDIAAIQYLYGANNNYKNGNDTYTFHQGQDYFQTIYDSGGVDTIACDASTQGAKIDLRPGGYGSYLGNDLVYSDATGAKLQYTTPDIFIYISTIIENAIGGSAGDTITGNQWDNELTGGGGDDAIDGGDGVDTAIYSGKKSDYSVTSLNSVVTVLDLRAGSPDGMDNLISIENIKFSDGTLLVSNLIDTTAPTVTTFSPADEATGIAIGSNIVLSFSEAIAKGTGNIILKTSAGAVVATYDAASSTNLSISGSTLTINPSADLGYSTGYSVEFAAGSIKDLAGNNYAGTTTYNFTTAAAPDTLAPTVSTFSPADEATAVAIGSNIVLSFSEAIAKGTGNIILKTAAGVVVATYDVASSANLSISGSTITVNPSADLGDSTAYSVEFAAGSIKDLAGNNYAGVTDYNFTTAESHKNLLPTGSVTISGPATQGQTLTAANTLADLDGLGTISYQWRSGGVAISGATASTYVLTQAEVGKAITVSASYTDLFNHAESVSSSATTAVAIVYDFEIANASVFRNINSGIQLSNGNIVFSYDREARAEYSMFNASGSDLIAIGRFSDIQTNVPAIVRATSDGGWVACWYQPYQNEGICIQRFDFKGDRIGNELFLHGLPLGGAAFIDTFDVLSNGTYLVTKLSDSLTGYLITPTGNLTSLNLQVVDGINRSDGYWHQGVTPLPQGGFDIVWTKEDSNSIYKAEFNPGGILSNVIKINSITDGALHLTSPVIAAADDFTVIYWAAFGSGFDIFGRKVGANGDVTGAEIHPNITTENYQFFPALTLLKDGGWIIGWTSYLEDGSGDGVYLRRYNSSGIAITGEIQISSHSIGEQDLLGLIALNNGGWIATYSSLGSPTVEDGVYAVRFNADGQKVEFNINNLPTGSVTISGTATQGQTLTASNTLGDIDGIGTITYQWKAGGSSIASETSNRLVLTEALVGKAIAVAATYTDGHGTVESRTSTASSVVVAFDPSFGFVELHNLTLTQNANNTTTVTFDVNFDSASISTSKITGAVIDLVYDYSKVSAAQVTNTTFVDPTFGTSVNVWGNVVSNLASTTSGTANGKIALTADLTTTVNPIIDTAGKAFGVTLIVDGLVKTFAIGLESVAAGGSTAINTADQVMHNVDVGFAQIAVAGAGKTVDMLAYSWNAHTLLSSVILTGDGHSATTGGSGVASFTAVTGTSLALSASLAISAAETAAVSQAVNLQDAIAILKMIVGLDVNGAGKALSPYQAYAADYDGNGKVELSDAIGVLKHVVGLDAPTPQWLFFNELDTTVPGKANLLPGSVPGLSADLSGSGSIHVGLVGVLRGDVDGSYAGAAGALDLDTDATHANYFTLLLAAHKELSPSQFGVYPYP